MTIPPDKVAEVLERTDLVALIGRYVELKKRGRSYVGRCPFHDEKTPSFNVHPDRQFFYCFGCHATGDAIAFVRRHQGKGFVDAVTDLAREAGVEIRMYEDPSSKERAALRQVNELAERHFAERLWDEKVGRGGREVLEKRGVSFETARAFGLGWALPEWNDFASVCAQQGVIEFAVQAGLLAPRRSGDGFYDVFRGRLMIPIRDPSGRPIAFGGRHVLNMPGDQGEGGPKYLNSKESRIYVKGEVLFGLDVAKEALRSRRQAILVEGYFDCIGLHQVGVTNAVALCSTALTAEHLRVLNRSEVKELVLLFDADEAGHKAVERLAPAILSAGAMARVAVLPLGQDPDEFALLRGGAAVDELVSKAPALTDHLLGRALPSGKAASWEQKVQALRALRPVIEAMPASVEKTLFVNKVAEHLGVPESEVRAHLASAPRPARLLKPAPEISPAQDRPTPKKVELVEELLCALVVEDPGLAQGPEADALDQIGHLGLRSVAAAGAAAAEILASCSPEIRSRMERATEQVRSTLREPEARREAFADAARDLRVARLDQRRAQIRDELSRQEDLTDEAIVLHEELKELELERRRLLHPSPSPAKGPASGIGIAGPTS